MSKYHARKTILDGQVFDSKKEAKRWQELKLLEQAGEIEELKRQVPFELIPAQREPDAVGPRGGKKPGKVIERAVLYVADFTYWAKGGLVVEDTKGVRTPDYILKRKLMLYRFGIRILES
jgi:hypothetical protein